MSLNREPSSQASIKKEMIKQGLLDKHGKPNDKTPAEYLSQSVTRLSIDAPDTKVKTEKDDHVVPSEGLEAPPKRRVSNSHN